MESVQRTIERRPCEPDQKINADSGVEMGLHDGTRVFKVGEKTRSSEREEGSQKSPADSP